MRVLEMVGKVALVAVVLVMMSGCCADQDKKIRSLTIMNRQLNKDMVEKKAKIARLEERIASLQASIKSYEDLIQAKADANQNLRDQIAMLEKSLDERNKEYQALVDKVAGMGGGGTRGIPEPVGQLLHQLRETYPGLFTFDEASGRLRFGSDVTFDLGKAAVKPKAREALTKLAAILNQEEAMPLRIEIVGHTCNTPIVRPETKEKFPTNQVLSEARAEAVASVLTGNGVDVSRVTTRGMGESQPLAPNTSKANKARNRRVEIFLSMP